jgi:hypothetical protein
MAGKVDFVKLRAGTEDSLDSEEQVQVNQRNLIDKILARYADGLIYISMECIC